jgi:hypothetical protein
MPTRNRRWVFKLTLDRSEAGFINAVRRFRMQCSLRGICRYSPVYDTGITMPHSHSSNARVFAVWREAADVAGDDVWVDLAKTPRRTMGRQAEQRIIQGLDRLRGDDEAGRQFRTVKDWQRGSRAGVAAWRNNPLLIDTADDLMDLMDRGVYVVDVHLGNWGIVPRRPKLLTLIDPGQVQFTTNRAKDAAMDIPLL